jgi:integrase/recombinase XerD
MLFLLDSGVRASELIGIDLEDVDWTEQRVLIRHGKGGKERAVGIGERTADALRAYIGSFRAESPGRLFLTSKRQAMRSAETLEVLLRRIGERAGIAKVYPHRFRHAFATWAIESGAREIDVQLLLGHSDLTMIQHYARTDTSEQAVKAHSQLSPVRRLES